MMIDDDDDADDDNYDDYDYDGDDYDHFIDKLR